jgi:hypothetical protein
MNPYHAVMTGLQYAMKGDSDLRRLLLSRVANSAAARIVTTRDPCEDVKSYDVEFDASTWTGRS